MKKRLAIILSVVMLLALCACTAAPAETTGTSDTTAAAVTAKSFTVTVVHADKTEKVFTYETGEEKLGVFLENEGLIESEGADDGMFHTVDGEKADWNENQSYWAFYEGEEYAMTGIYATEIADGGQYKLVYTIG